FNARGKTVCSARRWTKTGVGITTKSTIQSTIQSTISNQHSTISRLCDGRLLEWLEELGQQERLEAVPADGDDLLLLRVQRHAGGAGQADAGALDDGARRDVAVVVGRVDGDEAHLIEASFIAVVVLVARRRLRSGSPPRLGL